MRLLAIETSSDACSCALSVDSAVYCRYEMIPRQHANVILRMVDSVLEEAGLVLDALDGLAFGKGPGSFTGLRIAAGVVQGLAYGAGLKVSGISTLAAVAQAAYRIHGCEQSLVALDARMNQVYYAPYCHIHGQLHLRGVEGVYDPGNIPYELLFSQGGRWCRVGHGWEVYKDLVSSEQLPGEILSVPVQPDAQDILTLARAAFLRGDVNDAMEVSPTYLRDSVVNSNNSVL